MNTSNMILQLEMIFYERVISSHLLAKCQEIFNRASSGRCTLGFSKQTRCCDLAQF